MSIVDPNYVDMGDLRKQDNVPLASFLDNADRADTSTLGGQPFFSGREAEIKMFRTTVNAIARGKMANATIVVEGPPGAGKSALLCQFIEELRSLPAIGTQPRAWLPVFMNAGSAMQPKSLMSAVDEAIALHLSKALIHAKDDEGYSALAQRLKAIVKSPEPESARDIARTILDRGVSAFGFHIGAKSDPNPASLIEVAALRQSQWSDWQIVLMLDEAQHISSATPNTDPHLLSSLHLGAVNLPMTFCAFGLPGTSNALANVGVSRTSFNHSARLSSLDPTSSEMVVDRCFTRYGVEDTGCWKSAILERSANWPQHLACYLNSALTTIRQHAGVADDLGAPDDDCLSIAIRQGDAQRKAYYGQRIKGLSASNFNYRSYAKHIIPMLRNAEGGLPLQDIGDALTSPPLSLPASHATDFLNAAQRSGLFVESDDGHLQLAIPTFAGYVMGEEPPPIPEPSAQSLDI
ncbi:MAG: ATP-binding protein [Gammaproteobacteria bacterium]|nr:ATP-binding protein [Gammaproteobacteria bacterium]MDE0270190.1 ATP-binding protein [Gammaproteobacteria bacterium]